MNMIVDLLANIYLIKDSNRYSIKKCEICSKLTMKTAERRHKLVSFHLLQMRIQKPAKRL